MASTADAETAPSRADETTEANIAHYRRHIENRLNCTYRFDELYYCATPVNQFLQLYRHGKFDDCSTVFHNFRLCMMAKLKSTEEEKRLYLKNTPLDVEKEISSSPIWQFKATPSWD